MIVKMDSVNGHSLQRSAFAGRIVRVATISVTAGELPSIRLGGSNDSTMLVKSLARVEIPSLGTPYPHANYQDWIVRDYQLRSISALNYVCLIIYEWTGVTRIRDVSTLSTEISQIDFATQKPYEISYLGLRSTTGTPQKRYKSARIPVQTPMRHLIYEKTVKFKASGNILTAFPSVNKDPWMGYGTGFWLFSGIEGESYDNGNTYTYRAIFSSRVTRDWSEFDIITDHRGLSITFSTAEKESIRNVIVKQYIYGQNNSADGFLRVGAYPLSDFISLFGVS